MAFKTWIFVCLVSIVHSNTTNLPKVYEDVKEEPEENIRVARHPKFHQTRHEPPKFDYKSIIQQDPQKIRYAQQQQVDSYIRAYQHEHNLRRGSKSRKQNLPSEATAYDTRPKSENIHQAPRQINSNKFPSEADTRDQHKKKVVDPKTGQTTNNNNFANNQKIIGYKVNEDIDLDPQPSHQREAKVYIGQEDLLRSALSANYLAKPTYVLANPQLNIDPKLLMHGLQYALPENHKYSAAGFQQASETDIEALSSLLGKTPNVQLQGLTELLGQQSGYSGPEINQVPIKDVSVQPEALLGLQDHTPIKEEIPDFSAAKLHLTPKTHVDINSHSHTQINHEVKIVPEVKSIYEGHDDNLPYAAQYAFGYKIRDYHSGSNFGHEEVREGDVAKGHYHVLLPDGRLQNVDYWADPSGYHAKVTYSNVAQH